MRNRRVVCYDVADPPRRARTYRLMQGYGDPVRYSVFLCELSGVELAYMGRDLTDLLNMGEDGVMVADTGPVENGGRHIFTIGSPLKGGRKAAVVI